QTAQTITIDSDAAGHGWFTDPTPGGNPAAGRVDLLTVVAHELGHVLGIVELDGNTDLMAETLPVGVRRVPAASDLAATGAQDAFYSIIAGTSREHETSAGYDIVTGLGNPVAKRLVPGVIASGDLTAAALLTQAFTKGA